VHLVREYGMDGNTLTYESVRPVVHLADLLGSTVATFDAQGNTIADRYYGAFGDERQASGAPTPAPATALALFDDDILRGYTGHHSLSESRLVHMGGRGYDAKLGRFLSADPAWQMPYSSQSWNRYSYALNSPYRFTDPTGYEVAALFFDGSVGNALDADSMRDMIIELGIASGRLSSDFEIELFRHYWAGTGEDITLSEPIFADLVRQGRVVGKREPVLLGTGEPGYSAPILFYQEDDAGYPGSVDYDYGIGEGRLYFDLKMKPVGFYDNYNFNPAKRTSREAEILTRLIGWFGDRAGAEPYLIRYGVQGDK
jgi:RHS repeat-associated protein